MKKAIIIFAALFTLTAFTIMADTWKNDKPHSELGFSITHLGISDISGNFKDFDVNVTTNKPDFSDAVFELTANVASIDTRVEPRDNHLKSPDFFDVAKYPTLSFKSTSIKKNGKDKYKLGGDLTIHGITKPVTMDLLYRGTTQNPMTKATTVGFQLTGSINRLDFGVGAGYPPPGLSDAVTIRANGEFVKK